MTFILKQNTSLNQNHAACEAPVLSASRNLM